MNYRDINRPMGLFDKSKCGIDSSKTTLPSHGGEKPMMGPKMPTQMTQNTLNLFPVDEGFVRGTIFRGIYDPYLIGHPLRPVPTNERERMLNDVNKYHFALHEMTMYLDLFPEDQEAIDVFTEFQRNYIKAKDDYEMRFNALDLEAANLNRSPWNWTVGKWPWEGDR